MMTDKEKRKVNPRRRLLLKLILGIGLIVALVSLGIYALRPTGAQIVFIVNRYNPNIWIAEADNPENARQLTYHETGSIGNLQISGNDFILYERFSGSRETWLLNLNTFEYRQIEVCENCTNVTLQANSDWVAYQEHTDLSHGNIEVLNLVTAETRLVSQIPIATNTEIVVPNFRWLDEADILVFPMSGNTFTTDEYGFYSIQENRVIDVQALHTSYWSPLFSPDKSLYAYNDPLDLGRRTAIIRETSDSNEMLLSLPSNTENHSLERADIFDWHPSNGLLIGELWYTQESLYSRRFYYYELNLYDIYDDNIETLRSNTEFLYASASFNANSSQILYSKYHSPSGVSRIAIYDLQSGEELELLLPLGGYSPQWVNGGR